MPATILMGVLNVTPDSFSDPGRFRQADAAIAGGIALADDGAHWIDVGGESTRPGASPVSEEEERARIVPVIEALNGALAGRTRLAVDTFKAGTARAAIAAGATIVNDVSGGLLDPAILDVAAEAGAAIILGHLRGAPAQMMDDVSFRDVVTEVAEELSVRIEVARRAGCREIWADPGIGFGKRSGHNLSLLAELPRLCRGVGVPVLIGVSRKRFIGELTGQPVDRRVFGTAAAVAAAILGGAAAVRVHDVAAMRDVVQVVDGICAARRS